MKKTIGIVFLTTFIAIVFYKVGWYKGYGYEAALNAMGNGNIDLLIAKAIRKKNYAEALAWAERDLNNKLINLHSLNGYKPKEFTEVFKKISSMLEEYQNEYKLGEKRIPS